MACVDKVLVVGGGPAGLTAAAALCQKGVACDLVEISPTGEPVGAAITFGGRAIDAMHEIGVADTLREAHGALGPEALGVNMGPDGEPLSASTDAGPAGPLGQQEFLGLYRPLLSATIRDRAESQGASIRLGTTVETLRETESGVSVAFSDGTSATYDMVVGADGARSRVRSLVFGDDVKPEFAGQYALRWMAPGPPITAGPPSHYFAPFGRLLGYPMPRQNLIYVAAVLHEGPSHHLDPAESRDLLRGVLATFTAPYVVELRKRLTDDQTVNYRPYEWLMVPPPWHRGRVVLIGDAAHATTAHLGSGGAMAVEDAVVLAQSVDQEPTLHEAFAAFMSRRFERARLVVETSLALSRLEKSGAPVETLVAVGGQAFRKLAEPY